MTRRAYINPLPGYGEAAQRADILAKFDKIDEWYVESKRTTRADFIQHLRAGDEAIVAKIGCLARGTGRIDVRMADLLEARGDIHAKGCVVIDADGLRSNSGWLAVKEVARQWIGKRAQGSKSALNGSSRKYSLTDAEVKTVIRICDSKRYTNDRQRLTALKKEGIKIGRTYMVTDVPRIARERGLLD